MFACNNEKILERTVPIGRDCAQALRAWHLLWSLIVSKAEWEAILQQDETAIGAMDSSNGPRTFSEPKKTLEKSHFAPAAAGRQRRLGSPRRSRAVSLIQMLVLAA